MARTIARTPAPPATLQKVFVINLDRHRERRRHMEDLCSRHGLPCEIVEAVDGRRLDRAVRERVYRESGALATLGRPLTDGEIGCALSHLHVYRRMVDQGIETALVLEDDVRFSDALMDVLGAMEGLPGDWEVVLLGHHRRSSRARVTQASLWFRRPLTEGIRIARFSEMGAGTYGYLVNRAGAARLLIEASPLCKPIDHYTGDGRHVNVYGVVPPCVLIHDDLSAGSGVGEERFRLDRGRSGGRRFGRLLGWGLRRTGLRGLAHAIREAFRDLWYRFRPCPSYGPRHDPETRKRSG